MAEDIIKALVVRDQLERVEGRNENVTYNLPKDHERKLEDFRNQQEFDRAAKADAQRAAQDKAEYRDQLARNRERFAAEKEQARLDKAERDAAHDRNTASKESRRWMFKNERKEQAAAAATARKADADAAKIEQQRQKDRAKVEAASKANYAKAMKAAFDDRAALEEKERIRKENADHLKRLRDEKTASGRANARRDYEERQRGRNPLASQTMSEKIGNFMHKPTTMEKIKGSIKSINDDNRLMNSTLDGMATSLLGGMSDAMYRQPTTKEINRNFNQESKHLSAAFRNKQIGKKNPINDVIGVSGTVRRQYVTDGHGRSGQRATLEWRRANRQYASPERAAAASINENWMSSIMGTTPAPVRHRKVKAKDKGLSPIDRFNRLIG